MVTATVPNLAATLDRLELEFGLSTEELAAVLDVTTDRLARLHAGAAEPVQQERQRLSDLLALDIHLHETITDDGIPRWLRRENHYLGGATPIEVMLTGRFDRVDNALGIIDHGIFT
jgi:ribosome-binding protein aMBF1 (putative translation factor)